MRIFALGTLILFALALEAQIAPDEMTIHSAPYLPLRADAIQAQVELVEIPVVVRDKGRTVADLDRTNFEVLDGGRKREIVSFNVEKYQQSDKANEAEAKELIDSKPA